MAENQETMTKRELVSSRLKSKYPDRQYEDDEAMFGQIEDDYNDYESQLGGFRDRESKLNDLLSRDPKSAQFISDMAKGKDPWIAVIERLGIDGVTDILNDPTKKEEYAEANKAYVERMTQERGYEEEYNKNLNESIAIIGNIQRDRGLSDETVDAAMELIMKVTNEAIMGKFTEETMDIALKALNHDADVENATAEGEVAGRNAKIEERLRRAKSGGDGMPVMAGSNSGVREQSRPKSMFDLAADAK